MKTRLHVSKYCLAAALLVSGAVYGAKAANVTVNPGAAWLGFMNVFELPSNGGGYAFGSPWGPADLNASFSGATLTLTPNTSISRDVPLTDGFWWTGAGNGNKSMAASMYVEDNSLAGQSVTFSGNVLANTLVSPYTSVAFIKEFDGGYGLVNSTSVPLINGVFNINLVGTTGVHIQYGFETVGPNARLDQVAGFGSVQITAVPEPATGALFIGGLICWIGARRSKLVSLN